MRKLLLVATLLGSAATAHAQATPYYILDGDAQRGFIIQGGVLQSTFLLPYTNGWPLYAPRFDASGSTFLVSNRDASGAVEFNASGTPTGTTYSNGGGVDQLLDGGTDGTYAYAVRCCSTADGIYRGSMSFGGMSLLSSWGNSGVTFANSIGHLFSLDFAGNLFELALDGTLLNTWGTQIGRPTALAYEASTNSLWLAANGTNQVYNYSLAGQRLSSMAVAGLAGNFYGGEMANAVIVTPEPATLGLFATGLLGIAGVARRRRARARDQ